MSSNTDRFTSTPLSRNGSGVLEAPDFPEAPRYARTQAVKAPRKPRLGRLFFVLLVVLTIGAVAGILPKLHQRAEVAAQTRELAIPTVNIVSAAPGKAPPALQLSGELKPLIDAPIYARATGYVRKWSVDIGAHVEAGQTMAELDIPDLDQQLAQARADLKHSEAALDLANITDKRWAQMLAAKTVSPQEADEKGGAVALDKAAVDSSRANVDRTEQLVGFAKITAPFAGTVTARTLDVGQLVNAGSGQELFHVAMTDKLRVFVRVPQNYAHSVVPDQAAEITLSELPGRKFPAKVVRSTGSIDAASRTLLTELEVDNSKGELLAGSYAQVRLADAKADAALTVPANTLLFRPGGPVVAVVNDNHVSLRPVTLGRDFGTDVELLEGVKLTDQLVINPPDSLVDGVEVRVNQSPAS
jgi:membrane fusion protein (multidrug efflux system)